ncbi:MAG TPA: hypothetical protein VHE83_18165 [Mycobacteriales bacterium]|nr:hypothetical protein [Mycobacteriales bacterium]
MTPRGWRIACVTAIASAALPTMAGLVLVRSADAAVSPLGRYGLTAQGAGVGTQGQVGASGGLVVFDAGAGTVSARLDNAPSGKATAVAFEPGSSVRTVVSTANTTAGQTLATIPQAEAASPGGKADDSYAQVPGQSLGPLALTAGTGEAHVRGGTKADLAAAGGTLAVSGLVDTAGAHAEAHLSADPGAHQLSATASSGATDVTLGPLVLHDVVGTATVDLKGLTRSAAATVTVGSASVAGIPVTIDADGVHVAGQELSPPSASQSVIATVDSALAAAGISVSALDPVHTTKVGSALADSGGLVVSLHTKPVQTGLPVVGDVGSNDLSLIIGRVSVTESDGAATPAITATFPSAPPPSAAASTPPAVAQPPPGPVGGGLPVTPISPVTGPPPAIAPSAPAAQPQLALLGHHLPARAALAGFAAWQLIATAIATLAALAARRRGPEEEHLCPCP